MLTTISPCELDPQIAPEFGVCEDPESFGTGENEDTEPAEAAELETSFEPGAWSLRADGGRKRDEDEDDSDLGRDDFDYDDDVEENDDVDDDLGDDENLEEDFDDLDDDDEDL